MIPHSYKDFYGNETRWFLGIVHSTSDPEQLGRIQVRIFGIHGDDTTNVPNEILPWAHVVAPITEGGSSGIGANTGIKELAQVYGIFLDGKNSQVPLVLGSIPKVESDERDFKSEIPASSRDADNELLFGGQNIEKAFNFFISPEGGGFSVEQACGILGNFHVENGNNLRPNRDFDPDVTVVENDGARAYGLAQWNDAARAANRKGGLTRYAELIDFSAKNGYNYKTMYAQLQYTKYELFKYKFLGVGELQRALTVEDASIAFEKNYLRPAAGSTDERVEQSKKYFEELI